VGGNIYTLYPLYYHLGRLTSRDLPFKIVYISLTHMRATCQAYIGLLDLTDLSVLGKA